MWDLVASVVRVSVQSPPGMSTKCWVYGGVGLCRKWPPLDSPSQSRVSGVFLRFAAGMVLPFVAGGCSSPPAPGLRHLGITCFILITNSGCPASGRWAFRTIGWGRLQ